jgi:Mce-associated membrane protein
MTRSTTDTDEVSTPESSGDGVLPTDAGDAGGETGGKLSRRDRRRQRKAGKAGAGSEEAEAGDTAESPTISLTKEESGATGPKRLRRYTRPTVEEEADSTDAPATAKRRRSTRTKRPGSGLRKLVAVLGVISVLLAGTLIFQLIKGPGNSQKLETREDRREAARQAAETAIPRLFSYDYRHIDQDVAAYAPLTTGDFTKQVAAIASPVVKPLAVQNQAVVQAVALNSAVVDDSNPTDVQVLVFVDQATSSKLLSAPRLDRNRALATMRLVGRDWKVANIRLL